MFLSRNKTPMTMSNIGPSICASAWDASFWLFLMPLEQPHANYDQGRGPESGESVHVEQIQISEEIQTAKNDQCNATPEFSIAHAAELLLQPVDGRFQDHALGAHHPLLRG